MKKIPYGIDDYDRIIKQNYYYIDKTRYIRTVEEQNAYLLLVRPRRMGKSLFTNMLMSYYDINKADEFNTLFGDLEIGKKPTEWVNKFVVFKLDFSQVGDSAENLPQEFTQYCFVQLEHYFNHYQNLYTEREKEMVMSLNNITHAIVMMVNISKEKGLHTYLFIDEYDNFTNTILAARGVKAHEAVTHGDGFYRKFFQGCKGTFERIFMTGVSPVTYDDLTSGFHIADVIALSPRFNQAIGVTETELRQIISYYRKEEFISRSEDEIIEEIKPWYDNFCFSSRSFGKEPTIYNTDMVLRYLKELILEKQSPEIMVDYAARIDYKKLDHLVLAEDLSNREDRIATVREICSKGYTLGEVQPEFPARDCGDERNFKSMLYYYGTLTFGGIQDGMPRLIVPNKNMGDLYLDYMLKISQDEGLPLKDINRELDASLKEAAVDGQWKSLIDNLGEITAKYSSVRNDIRGEWDIQGFLRGLLCLNRFYDVWPELELGHGFSDILLVPRNHPDCPTHHSYIIEIKYLKSKSEVDNSTLSMENKIQKEIALKIKEACDQLQKYITDHHLTGSHLLHGTSLTALYLIFQNHTLVSSGEYQIK